MDAEFGVNHEHRGHVRVVESVSRLAKTQLRLDGAIRVREKCPAAPSPARNAALTSGGSTLIETIRE